LSLFRWVGHALVSPFVTVWHAFRGVTRREALGYFVLLIVTAVIGIPELVAAIRGDKNEFPTISGTIAHLEYFNNWVAIVVIATIVWGAFHAYRVPSTVDEATPKDDVVGWRARRGQRIETKGGWLETTEDVQPIGMWYFALAAVAVVGGGLLTAGVTDDRYTLGYVVYSTIGFFFLVLPGLLARKKRLVPFPSLFATIKDLERRVRAFAVIILAGLAVLLIHLVLYPWPSIIPDLKDQHDQYEKQRQHPQAPIPKPPHESPSAGAT